MQLNENFDFFDYQQKELTLKEKTIKNKIRKEKEHRIKQKLQKINKERKYIKSFYLTLG